MASDVMDEDSPIGPKISSPTVTGGDWGDRYEILHHIQASVGGRRIYIGKSHCCSFCQCRGRSRFRTVAHTFPEGLGNKWVFSRDECDSCNALFSRYEDELVKALSPFLTLGAVKGKGNKVRQTGRTSGKAVLKHSYNDARRNLSVDVKDANIEECVGIDKRTGQIIIDIPLAPVAFSPRLAYKALCKMGFALLPEMERKYYQQLRGWLLEVEDSVDFPDLEVSISTASIGNAPQFVCGTLLRRRESNDPVPYILFLLTIGSLCFQIDLRSDYLEDHLPPSRYGEIQVDWTILVKGPEGERPLKFVYGNPVHMNWSSRDLMPQPIDKMRLNFQPDTRVANFVPSFRTKMRKS